MQSANPMVTQPQSQTRLAFGPFEVNPAADELLKGGVRIRLPGQPFQILLILLAHPGEVVTREELRDRIWSEGTFVDFEHGLNAAINKLRRTLGDSADHPRYIETIPGHGYRFIGVVEQLPSTSTSLTAAPSLPLSVQIPAPAKSPLLSPVKRWLHAALAIAACLVSFLIGWTLHHPPTTESPWRLTRLTADAGSSNEPAISPDGKLLAYSSDAAKEGQYDLYIKQIAGGDPIRLTFDGANNTEPDFSPDGSRIVFVSNRDGGGIYEIPAFGGEERLLARGGRKPRFSPDGSKVAYWIGAQHVALVVPGSASVWVVPAAGGNPQQVGTNFAVARSPIWAPDSRHLLVIGYISNNKTYDSSSLDWWIVPTNGGPALRTGMYDALGRARQLGTGPSYQLSLANPWPEPFVPWPYCWLPSNDIVFSAPGGDTSNLWQTGISLETGKVSGAFKRLTTGAGNEIDQSCALNGAIAFINSEIKTEIWNLPFDLNSGQPKGILQQITQGIASREGLSLSSNGGSAAFSSNQSGTLNIWLLNLATGQESHVANSAFVQRYPAISPSGSKVAFSSFEHNKRVLYVSTPGGSPEQLCDNCLRATDWSHDEKKLLVFSGVPYQINIFDIASHQQTPLLKHPAYNFIYGHFSPDDRWVSFTARFEANRSWIAIAPLDGPLPVPESAWIKIAEAAAEDWANWSPDGKTLYFTSPRDGHTCLWGQRIDANTHQPVGAPFVVQHLHGRAAYRQLGWSAANGRIAILLRESSDNIWMMSRAPTGSK